jgi:hypothetical protein
MCGGSGPANAGKSLEVCLTSQNESCRCANIQIEIGVDWCPQNPLGAGLGVAVRSFLPGWRPPDTLHARRNWCASPHCRRYFLRIGALQ